MAAPDGSVELNGLNLDGNASPTSSEDGLRVTAGKFVLSNDTIAVNKGHILLRGGTATGELRRLSRWQRLLAGWDSVGADGVRGGGDDVKIGYRIAIEGANLGLFDNTTEFASVPGLHAVTLTADGTVVLHRLDRASWWTLPVSARPRSSAPIWKATAVQLHRVLFGQWTSI